MKTEIVKSNNSPATATLNLPTHAEHCITVVSEQLFEMAASLRQAAQERHSTLLSQFVFAATRHHAGFVDREPPQPVAWLQGDACGDGGIYSMQGVALSGLEVRPIVLNGRDMGVAYEDDHARYCRLRGVIPADLSLSRTEQTRSTFETVEAALELGGCKFTDIVRTWIYLDHLLEWYDDFNAVRSAYFQQSGVFEHLVPASTGIGAGNQYGAALLMDVLAIAPKAGSSLQIQEVVSPLQNPALDYKSSFSRAIELVYPTHRNVLISGTASIDPSGATVYADDPEKQIRLTMEVVHEILKSRGMQWNDLFRGIAYFKNMDFLPIYQRIAAELGIPPFPLAISHADVCRHDLLFEIEVDAVRGA